MELVRYDAACRAVAEAKTIDEVKEIANRAEAVRAYARQAKNRLLEIDAVEIRVRAERRLGEILIDLRSSGHIGSGRGGRPMRLEELGVDKNISGGAQRLAKLPANRFADELTKWRETAETAQRFEAPLQRYRRPSVRAGQERVAVRFGRKPVNHNDPLDQFRAIDGRRIADWRSGELDRIERLAERTIYAVKSLRAAMPIANPDPLDTMEMIFRDCTQLVKILSLVWREEKVPSGKTGVDDVRIAVSRAARQRQCERCGKQFTMRNPSGKGRSGKSNEGRFCSRECMYAGPRKK